MQLLQLVRYDGNADPTNHCSLYPFYFTVVLVQQWSDIVAAIWHMDSAASGGARSISSVGQRRIGRLLLNVPHVKLEHAPFLLIRLGS